DVLAVVAFVVREPEEPLFENRIVAVPQRKGKAKTLLVVGDAREAVFAPVIRARAGVLVREVVPGVAVVAVILADGSPLPLAQVRTPLLPRDAVPARGHQTSGFFHRSPHSS